VVLHEVTLYIYERDLIGRVAEADVEKQDTLSVIAHYKLHSIK